MWWWLKRRPAGKSIRGSARLARSFVSASEWARTMGDRRTSTSSTNPSGGDGARALAALADVRCETVRTSRQHPSSSRTKLGWRRSESWVGVEAAFSLALLKCLCKSVDVIDVESDVIRARLIEIVCICRRRVILFVEN